MRIDWKKQVRTRTTLLLLLSASITGVGLGLYEGLIAQAIVVEVHYPGATANIPWTCSIQMNNDPAFKNFTGSGTQTWTFYNVHNILATCSKADNSIYSIAVALKSGTGRFMGESSGYPTTTIGCVRPSGTCYPASQFPATQAPTLRESSPN